MNDIPPLPPSPPRFFGRFSTTFKLIGIFILVLVLLIPLGMIQSLLRERLQRRDAALNEITSTWGREQLIGGPVLVVPYTYQFKEWRTVDGVDGRPKQTEVLNTATARAYFLPASLAIDGAIEPQKLHRGIYDAVVYGGTLSIAGAFDVPDFAALKIAPENIQWADATLSFAITDLRGARTMLEVKLGDRAFRLVPGSKVPGLPSGVYASVPGLETATGSIPFSLDLSLNGSRGLSFAPIGVQNSVRLKSKWPDPSFRGAFLPSTREVTPDGFSAEWQVSYYGRSYPQSWTDAANAWSFDSPEVRASLFGVDFISVVDAYRYVERSIKYGILFLVLVFTAFFLFEVLASLRIHAFQYTLVGAALILFYLLLLSLSEFLPFLIAYAASAVAATVLIALYSHKVLRSGARTLTVTALLAAVYTFLCVALRLQDYSLVFGSIGLFVVLAVVMYVTRNIDWYARDAGRRE